MNIHCKRMLLVHPDVFEKAENAFMSAEVSSNGGSDNAASHPPLPPTSQEGDNFHQKTTVQREFLFSGIEGRQNEMA